MSLAEILGLETARRLFKNQLNQGRLSHAYLFVGPSGIGKKTLAVELAKSLQCISFPDLIQSEPASETKQLGIDSIRMLSDSMALTPYQGRWKVGIIEDADRMTEESMHACLKLLEEPPEKSVLILIAQAAHRLPATLVSRCHLVRCAPQGVTRVAAFLQSQEKMDPAMAAMLAVSSGGRLGKALDFYRSLRWKEKNVKLNELLQAHRSGTLEVPLGKASRLEIEEALGWWTAWWRDGLLLKLGGDPAWVIHQDRLPELKEAVRSANVESLLERIERAYWVQAAIEQNASPRIALAALLSHHG